MQLVVIGYQTSGYCLYSGCHRVSFRLFVMIVIKTQSLECVWVTVGVHQLLHISCCNNESSYLKTLSPITDSLCVCGRYIGIYRLMARMYVCIYYNTYVLNEQ